MRAIQNMRKSFFRLFCNSAQRVVEPLTGEPCDAGSVCVLCNVSRSRVNPSEHVGKQISGGAGWRACAGRGGTWFGLTSTGKAGGVAAQAVTSTASSGSSSAGALSVEGCGINGLLLSC
jgi:hypothetical protein